MISTNEDLSGHPGPVRTLPRPSVLDAAGAVRVLDAILGIAGLLAAIMIITDAGGPVRAVISLTACLLLPGWALLRLLGVRDLFQLLMLGVITSAVLVTGLALGMVWSEYWHPDAVAVVLVLMAVGALVFRLWWESRAAAPTSASATASIGRGRPPMSRPAQTVADLPFPPSEPDQ